MSAGPRFWAGPAKYLRWASREKPAYFWSCVMGAAGPVMLITVPPIRHRLGDEDAPPIPLTYPGTCGEQPPPPPDSILPTSPAVLAPTAPSNYAEPKALKGEVF